MRDRDNLLAFLVCVIIVLLIDAATNNLDIVRCSWDCKHYIALAEQGFDAQPLQSPFAYRYATPFIAARLSSIFGIPTEFGFRITAYAGAILQLFGVFLFIRYITKTKESAYLAILVTAFSLFNVKFLMFDVYRPDHLAYTFILLGFYFCLTHRFYLLLIATAIGAQFREFALVPLLSYLLSIVASRNWKTLGRYVLPFLVCIVVAVMLPRILIPVTGSSQYVEFSLSSIPRILKTPFYLKRDINLAYSILAYSLPTMMLLTVSRLRLVIAQLPEEMRLFLISYTLMVIVLSLYGGSDFVRFVTYLFLPQALLVGLLSRLTSRAEVFMMLLAVFIFNRIWMYIPIWNFDQYLDFYGGYSDRVNSSTICRFAELLAFLALSILVRHISIQQSAAADAEKPRR